MSKERENLELECENQLKMLNELYSGYTNRQSQKKKGVSEMFAKWVRNDANQIEPVSKEFLKNVESLIGALDNTLSSISCFDRSLCEKLCGRALLIIFAHKPANETNDTERYLAASEYLAPVLFKYASRDDMNRIREELLARIPRRLMYPKQREIVDMLGEMLSS